MKSLLFVGLGGFAGSVCRYLVREAMIKLVPSPFPYGTFIANVTGCFIIGAILAFSLKENTLSGHWKLFMTVGFCGGFTTFSSFSSESLTLFQNGQLFLFISYIFLSILIGLIATYLGLILFK